MAAPQIVPAIYGQDVKKIHLAEFVASIQSAINTLHLRTSQGVIDAADEIQGYLAQALAAAEAAENAAEETQLVPSGGRFLADGETNTISVSGVYISPYLFSVYVGTEYQHPATYSVSNDGSNTTISFGENFPRGVWVEYTALRKKEVSIAALDLGDVQPFLDLYGLGAVSPPTISDFTGALKPGLYRYLEASAVNAPGEGQAWAGACVVMRPVATGRISVLATRANPANPRTWIGHRSGDTGPLTWFEVMHQASMVGTVSQVAGVPKGAVMQRGSNGNGDFVRFADGTQICWHKAMLGSVTANGSGTFANPYFSNSFTWDFPAAFAFQPTLNAQVSLPSDTPTANGRRNVVPQTASNGSATSAVSIKALRFGSDATADTPQLDLMAVGRWF